VSLKELIAKRTDLENQIKAIYDTQIVPLQDQISDINIDIDHIIAPKLVDIRSLQKKEFGAVNITLDGYKVTSTIPKKVEWDQAKLLALFDTILQSGDKPSNYMRMELKVAEKDYAGFVPEIKAVFAEARTVKPGNASVKIEEVAE